MASSSLPRNVTRKRPPGCSIRNLGHQLIWIPPGTKINANCQLLTCCFLASEQRLKPLAQRRVSGARPVQEGSAFRTRPRPPLADNLLFSLVRRNHGNRSGNYYPILPHLEG